jgi:hypothetical protein
MISLEVNFDIEFQKMSYERQNYGGGNRRRRKGEANKSLNNRMGLYNHSVEPDYDYHDRRQEVFETPEQKLRTAIIKLGEVVCLTVRLSRNLFYSHSFRMLWKSFLAWPDTFANKHQSWYQRYQRVSE